MFNVLAAKHIFHVRQQEMIRESGRDVLWADPESSQTLLAEQLGSTYLLLRILPRHATHVRQANMLFCNDKGTPVRALAILSALPNLNRLVLDGPAAAQLFDNTNIFGFLDDSDGVIEHLEEHQCELDHI